MATDTEAKIAEWMKKHRISEVYDPERVFKLEDMPFRALFWPSGNHVFKVVLARYDDDGEIEDEKSQPMYVHTGVAWDSITLVDAIWHLYDESDHYDGRDFEAWLKENTDNFSESNDDDDDEKLSRDAGEIFYTYCKQTYERLIEFLGESAYEELEQIIRS